MNKIAQSILKEIRLLQRDIIGFVIIFLMPVVLIITITSIQNSVEGGNNHFEFPILIANQDNGALSKRVISDLENTNYFKIISNWEGQTLTKTIGKKLIKNGEQQVLIVIPPHFSTFIETQTGKHVNRLLSQVQQEELENASVSKSSKELSIYFDPVIRATQRDGIKRAIERMISELEKDAVYKTFEKEFDADFDFLANSQLITFKEDSIDVSKEYKTPTPVQHNLPAWTLFAIFFIVIPLSINIVKEKNQGTYVRLLSLPVPRFYFMISKIIVYLVVCIIQFIFMLGVSIYIFPLIGLPAFELNGKFFGMTVVTLFAGLAAIGYGVLIGTLAKTHEQAAPFGATSVVILAAFGGLWFPVFAMPESMQIIANFSPMNWGLEAFYDVLLRDASFTTLLPNLSLLLIFFIITITIALIYEKKVNQI